MTSSTAGWFNDPQNPQALRFFDGQQWTSLSRPVPVSGQPTDEMQAAGQQHMARLYGPTPPDSSGFQGQNQNQAHNGSSPNGPQNRKPKKSDTVWIVVGITLASIFGIAVWGPTPTANNGFSQDYKSIKRGAGYDCEALADQVLRLSDDTSFGDDVITKISDTFITIDNRSFFEFPENSFDSHAVAFECTGTATYADGAEQSITYKFSIDSNKDLWIDYDEKF